MKIKVQKIPGPVRAPGSKLPGCKNPVLKPPGQTRAENRRAQKTGFSKWPGRAARPGADP